MARGKSINLYLMDGDVNGRVKCTLANWTGLAFKIPRTSLGLCKDRDDLKQTGIYFLFGKDDENDNDVVYVGQAGIRKNGEGVLNRLFEHNRNTQKDYWTEAIAITTSNDSLGPTEISYLEHRFCQLAIEANRYEVKNGNDPTPGNPSEEKKSELEDFIDYAKVIVGILGHKVFIPLVSVEDSEASASAVELYCTLGDVNAIGIQTAEGFVVKRGSKLASECKTSCRESIKNKREKYSEKINSNGILLEDLLFNSPSGASDFVCGSSTNGKVAWKTANGITIKELEARTENK